MKKVILSALALSLILLFSVNASLAYLTDKDTTYNTFTVGQVSISLTEDTAARSEESKILIPGLTYSKKPVITVDESSEDCWLFVKLENGVEDIEVEGDGSIAAQMEANCWRPLEGVEDIYYYDGTVSAGTSVNIFDGFTISGDVNRDEISKYDGVTVGVTAYGIQAAGFDTAAEAWAQAKLS